MSLRNKVAKTNPFEAEVDIQELDAATYGSIAPNLDTGRVKLLPVDIMTIWADVTQPRKAVPLIVHGGKWDGNPESLVDVLSSWQLMAETAMGESIDVVGVLKGREQNGEKGLVVPENKFIAEAFISLLRLAASIYTDGLTNAITIASRSNHYLIETGERRWLAHHLLSHFVDTKFDKILAREVQYDRWRQASENNNREKYTAIQMARQLAILLMDMYEGDNGVHFDPMETMTHEGCDRRYYAQVAHGRVWQIKKGFGERVQAAMGFNNLDRVADYRKLLRLTDDEQLNDEIWTRADGENWTHNAIVTYAESVTKEKNVGKFANVPTNPQVSITPDKGASVASIATVDDFEPEDEQVEMLLDQWYGRMVKSPDGQVGKVIGVVVGETTTLNVRSADRKTFRVSPSDAVLVETIASTSSSVSASSEEEKPPVDMYGLPLLLHAAVITRTGRLGVIASIQGKLINVNVGGIVRPHYANTLERYSKPADVLTFAVGDTVKSDDNYAVGKIINIHNGIATIETPVAKLAYGVSRLTKVDSITPHKPTTPQAANEPSTPNRWERFGPDANNPNSYIAVSTDAALKMVVDAVYQLADSTGDSAVRNTVQELMMLTPDGLKEVYQSEGYDGIESLLKMYHDATFDVLQSAETKINAHLNWLLAQFQAE